MLSLSRALYIALIAKSAESNKKEEKDTQLSLQLTITKTMSHNHCFKMAK